MDLDGGRVIGRGPKLRAQASELVEHTERAVTATEAAVADVAADVSSSVQFASDELARAASVVALCAQLITAAVLAAFAVYALRVAGRAAVR